MSDRAVRPSAERAFRWLEATGLFANAGVWMVTLVGGYIMERLTTSRPGHPRAAIALSAASSRRVLRCGSGLPGPARSAAGGEGPAHLLGGFPLPDVFVEAAVAGDAPDRARRHGDIRRNILAIVVDDRSGASYHPSWSVAFSLDSFQWNIGQVVGPVLGGAVLRGGRHVVFFALCGALMIP